MPYTRYLYKNELADRFLFTSGLVQTLLRIKL